MARLAILISAVLLCFAFLHVSADTDINFYFADILAGANGGSSSGGSDGCSSEESVGADIAEIQNLIYTWVNIQNEASASSASDAVASATAGAELQAIITRDFTLSYTTASGTAYYNYANVSSYVSTNLNSYTQSIRFAANLVVDLSADGNSASVSTVYGGFEQTTAGVYRSFYGNQDFEVVYSEAQDAYLISSSVRTRAVTFVENVLDSTSNNNAASCKVLYGLVEANNNSYLQAVNLDTRAVLSTHQLDISVNDIAFDNNGVLYGVTGENVQRLNIINPSTGATVRFVGTTGTQGDNITGLVGAADGTIYASGNYLYRVNTATGQFARVGNTPFPSRTAGDLSFVGSNLYVVSIGQLLRVDTNTGVATVVASFGAEFLSLSTVCGSNGANVLLATAADGSSYQIDPATGNVVQSFGSYFSPSNVPIFGTATLNEGGFNGNLNVASCGVLYGLVEANNNSYLQAVNINTRAIVLNKQLDISVNDIAFDNNGVLYGVTGENVQRLNIINPSTGATVRFVGTTGTQGDNITGLVGAADGTIYASGNYLYRVNTATGQFARVGNTPFPSRTAGDLSFVGSNLYVAAIGQLLRVDTNTGVATVVAPFTTDYLSLSTVCGSNGANVLLATAADGSSVALNPSNGNVVLNYGSYFSPSNAPIFGTATLNEGGYSGSQSF